jgi:adenylate cyclase
MGVDPARWQGLLSELRRRKVFRAAGVYAVLTWLLVQVVTTTAPLLRLPEWVPTLVLVLLLVGFPVAVGLAWTLETTPEGVRRTEPAGPGSAVPDRPSPRVGIGLLLLTALGVGTYAGVAPGRAEREIGERSIAVLPFANVSGIEENEYFSDGITEDILTRLAELEGLRVISRTSVMTYKGSNRTVPEIAAELGVRYVLEGSVRRVGDQVRVTGQLIDARTDEHLWAKGYDRRITDVLALQGEIAAEIAEALALELSPEDRSRLGHRSTASAAAYELYLKGRDRLHADAADRAEEADHVAAAIAAFRTAIAADSAFAPAYAGLARAYRRYPELERVEQYDSALAYARQAVDRDPALPDAHVELGWAHTLLDHNEAAYDHFRAALRLSPNHAGALRGLGYVEEEARRYADAVRSLRRATTLDPNSSEAWGALAMGYYGLGYFPQAEAAYRRAIRDPQRLRCQLGHLAVYAADTTAARGYLRELLAGPLGGFLLHCVGVLEYRLGDHAAAEEHLRRYAAELPAGANPVLETELAYLALRSGRSAEAERRLRAAEARVRAAMEQAPEADGPLWLLGKILALRGRRDEAVEVLERTYARGHKASWLFTVSDVVLDGLRGHAGYEALLARMKADYDAMRAQVEREGLHR